MGDVARFRAAGPSASLADDAALAAVLGPTGQSLRAALDNAARLAAQAGLAPLPCLEALLQCGVASGQSAAHAGLAPGDTQWLQARRRGGWRAGRQRW